MAHDAVETVAMHDQHALAVGRLMHQFLGDQDAAEGHAVVIAQGIVVIARHQHDAGSLAGLAQDLLHHVIVALRPEPALLQAPAIDDIADQIEVVGFEMLEEIEQEIRLAAARPEMHVRDENRPIARCSRFNIHLCFVAPDPSFLVNSQVDRNDDSLMSPTRWTR